MKERPKNCSRSLKKSEKHPFPGFRTPEKGCFFHSKKYEYVVQEVWARAILHNFRAVIVSGVEIEQKDTSYEYQTDFSEACKTRRDFLHL